MFEMTAAWGQVRVQHVILQDDCGVQEGDSFRGGLCSEFDGGVEEVDLL